MTSSVKRRWHETPTLRGLRPHRKTACAILLAMLAIGCVPVPEELPETTPARGTGDPIELGIRLPDGSYVDLRDYRGEPLLIFVFATFDGASQASLQPIELVKRARPSLRVVGIAAQPDPRELVDAWVHALEPTFPVGYDPTGNLLAGETALGNIESVPLFVLIDASGVPLQQHRGFMAPEDLERFLDEER
jgi:hypothetical protein